MQVLHVVPKLAETRFCAIAQVVVQALVQPEALRAVARALVRLNLHFAQVVQPDLHLAVA
jgi:hypothetical protein